ncbi:MAG: 50S ribosomal protein L44e [Candidatus Aenigmatarchaeota archaeon]
MKMPKKQKRYCKFCGKHSMHSVSEAKRHTRRETTKSQRRFRRKLKGYGSFPKENPKGREKPTRKKDLRYTCEVCKKTHVMGTGFRVKKFELTKPETKQ